MIRLVDIPRNDVAAAMRYYRQERKKPSRNPMRYEPLFRLQDDPTELLEAMEAEERSSK